MKKKLALLALFLCGILNPIFEFSTVQAAVPNIILYEGRLLNHNGDPVTTPHVFRFSFWQDGDWQPADVQGDGSIETTAPNYAHWQEVQTITPDNTGIFSIQLGKETPLPQIDPTLHKFLQVEIKADGADDLDYQLMDPTGDEGADAEDRATIGSLPYAKVAENAEQSTAEAFILDQDNTVETAGSGDIRLQFGNTLGKYLSYDLDQHYFHFNDSVDISGDLTVSGLINGVDITALPGGHTQNTDTGTTAPSFVINSTGNSLTLQTVGLTAARNITFPDADTTLVGIDTPQTLSQKTIDGTENTFANIAPSALAPYSKSLLLSPAYPQMSIIEDGTDNLVTLKQGFDETAHQHFYILSSEENALQDIDLQIPIQIPPDFVSWESTPLQIFFKTLSTNAADNHFDVTLQDTAEQDVILSGASNLSGAVADTWQNEDITFGGGSTFTPGETIMLTLKLSTLTTGNVSLGAIQFNYQGR